MLNQVVLIGRITRDHELRKPGEHSVLDFTIAVDRAFNKDETDFINIVVWRKQAENTAEYTGKGSLVAVTGRLEVRDYTDKEGNKRKSVKVVADNVRFLDSKKSVDPPDDEDAPF